MTVTFPPSGTVTGASGTNFQILTGPGTGASLQFLGNVALEGSFAATGVTIGSTLSSLDLGALDLESHASLTDGGSLALLGDLQLDGTGALLDTTQLSETAGGHLFDLNSATLQAASATIGGNLFVDPRGVIEIGAAGGAAAGSLTVDSGATLSLTAGAQIDGTVGLAGQVSVLGQAFIEGDVIGTGAITVAGTSGLDVFGDVTGLAAIIAAGGLDIDGTASNVALVSLGNTTSNSIESLVSVGTVLVGAGAGLTVSGNVTGGGAIEVGISAALDISGTLSGLGRIDVGTGGTAAFTVFEGTLEPQDLDVPLNLGASTTLLIDTGVTIGGLVSGFAAGDLIAAVGAGSAQLVTGAAFAAGTLVLTDDGAVTNVISLAGVAGAQFLTNAVGLPSGLAMPATFGEPGTTDIALAAGTMTNLGTTGADTVTGALATGFEVLNGSGTATSLTFIDNVALEGSFSARQVTIAAGSTAAINALDLQAGATLAATAGALITSNVEVDGAAARFAVAGTLALGSGELLAVNGGTVQANALNLIGTAGGATVDIDPAGAIEVGTLADAQTGALLIDTGTTLANFNANLVIGPVIDKGTIAIADGTFDSSFLTIDGNLSGSGVVNVGTSDGLTVNGSVIGLTSLAIATSGELMVNGDLAAAGPLTLGSFASASLMGSAGGAGLFQIGPFAQASVAGSLTGFSTVDLAASDVLSLGGDATVPIDLAGTTATLALAAGLTLSGAVAGFAVGDLITVSHTLFGANVVTGASLAGGILSLTSDGTVTDLVTMTGNAGQQFLTNSVGEEELQSTAIVLPTATLAALGAGGTVTGLSDTAFDVLIGAAGTAAVTFKGNLALEGSYAATGTVTVAGSAVLDIEAGGSLGAAAAIVQGAVEVDGAGARFIASGSITAGGGDGMAELFAANAGLVQAAGLILAGNSLSSFAELAVDPTGRFEVGAAGTGAAGTLAIDAGSTLAADTATTFIEAPVADNGLLVANAASGSTASLDLFGSLSGGGTLAIGPAAEGEITSISAIGTITVGATASLTVEGNATSVGTITSDAGSEIAIEGSLTGSGGISIGTSAGLSIDGDLAGTGILSIGAGATASVFGSISGYSEILIGAGGAFDLSGDDLGVPIVMGAGTTLTIAPFATIAGAIEGFASGDAIAVSEAPSVIITEADLAATPGGGSLLLSDDGAITSTLSLTGSFGLQQFLTNVAGNGFGGVTDITLATPCFAAGTRIATTRGPVAVEALAVGDAIPVHSGGTRPVVWIGRRRIDCRRHPCRALVWPVEVLPHAFADGVPSRVLRLSPDHAVFVDGALIPIKHLINGRTIRQVEVREVTYFHVELSRHDVLWAEELPSESYLDTGNRRAFVNGGDHIALHPDFAPLGWENACAELLQEGPRVIAERTRLFARAGRPEVPSRALAVVADQHPLTPVRTAPGRLVYDVPAGGRSLHLVSPAWMPAACDPASLDRRDLGVRLFAVAFDGRSIAMDDPAWFSGVHAPELTREGWCRWTTGDARLVLPIGTRRVDFHVEDAVAASAERHLVFAKGQTAAAT